VHKNVFPNVNKKRRETERSECAVGNNESDGSRTRQVKVFNKMVKSGKKWKKLIYISATKKNC
jgi:hypothetical protein